MSLFLLVILTHSVHNRAAVPGPVLWDYIYCVYFLLPLHLTRLICSLLSASEAEIEQKCGLTVPQRLG